MEVDGGFKDPLKSRESEQEQEWKLRQVSSAEPWHRDQQPPGAAAAHQLDVNASKVASSLCHVQSFFYMSTAIC